MVYLLLFIPVLIVAVLIYANRHQAKATLADAPPEPNIDLEYRPPMPQTESKLKELLEKPRDPELARLSTEELVTEVLRECYDPEIPLNIVDLSLVYGIESGSAHTRVKMSLTAPGCPSSEQIKLDVKGKLQEAGFPAPEVEIVWEPQWTAHRISAEGRKKLGIETAEAAEKLIPKYPNPGEAATGS